MSLTIYVDYKNLMQRKASNCTSIKWKQLMEMLAAFHYKESPNDWIKLPQCRHYQGKKDYEGHLNQEIGGFFVSKLGFV